MRLAGLACSCGAVELIAVAPGQAGRHGGAIDHAGGAGRSGPAMLLRRPIAAAAWCAPCWVRRFGGGFHGVAAAAPAG